MASITKVQNKTGSTSYRVFIRQQGLKPITKTFSTKRLATAYAREVEGNRELAESLGNTTTGNIDLRALIYEYLGQFTGKDLRMVVSRHGWWSDHYGHLSINTIDPTVIRAALRELSKHGASGPTINRYKANLSAVFNFAVEEYSLPRNPCRQVKAKPEHKGRVRYLFDSERKALLTACRISSWDKLYSLVLMALTTGARRGELLALRWADMDFVSQLASVHDSKSGKPRRLPLTDEVLAELKRFRAVGDALLFHSEKIPTQPIEFRKSWYRALDEAGISDFRFQISDFTI